MNFQEQIQGIVDQAMIEKTFNLEIIEKIRDLKTAYAETEIKLKASLERIIELSASYSRECDEKNKYMKKVEEFTAREQQVFVAEKAAERKDYELEFQKRRADEIKELVGLVFRNPVIKSSSWGSTPVKDNNGYIQSGSTSETKEEHVE